VVQLGPAVTGPALASPGFELGATLLHSAAERCEVEADAALWCASVAVLKGMRLGENAGLPGRLTSDVNYSQDTDRDAS
jgi:hypothetical protein